MLLVLLVCLCKSFQRTLFISLAAPRQLKRASLRSTCTSFLFASRTLLNLVLLEVSFVLESGCKGITKSLTVQEFWRKSFKKVAFLVHNWDKSRQTGVFSPFLGVFRLIGVKGYRYTYIVEGVSKVIIRAESPISSIAQGNALGKKVYRIYRPVMATLSSHR